MKGRTGIPLGRPVIPLANISDQKAVGLGAPSGLRGTKPLMAGGGKVKKRADKKARGGASGIHIKPSHKGLLHEDLGVKKGEPIPEKKLEKAKNSSDPSERKRATFAENAKHWKKK